MRLPNIFTSTLRCSEMITYLLSSAIANSPIGAPPNVPSKTSSPEFIRIC